MSYGYARRVKNLRIDSVDSVDKGASGSRGSRGAVVTLMKRDDDSATAQALIKCAGTDNVSKAELSSLMEKLAHARRQPGETREQAFVAFITDGGLGSALYKILRASPGLDHRQEEARKFHHAPGEAAEHVADAADDDGENPYHAALHAMARKHVEQNPDMTIERAYAHLAHHNPTAKKLMAMATQHDLQRAARAQT